MARTLAACSIDTFVMNGRLTLFDPPCRLFLRSLRLLRLAREVAAARQVDAILYIGNTRGPFTGRGFFVGAADESYRPRVARRIVRNRRPRRRIHGEDAVPVVARVLAGRRHARRDDGTCVSP